MKCPLWIMILRDFKNCIAGSQAQEEREAFLLFKEQMLIH